MCFQTAGGGGWPAPFESVELGTPEADWSGADQTQKIFFLLLLLLDLIAIFSYDPTTSVSAGPLGAAGSGLYGIGNASASASRITHPFDGIVQEFAYDEE